MEIRRELERRTIRIEWPKFAGGRGLAADLVLAHPRAHESIVIATPIGARGFYYNEKTCALPAEGRVDLGGARIRFAPADAFGTLDWGRGLWPYRTFGLWASGAGRLADGWAIGINLGCGFGDPSAATENCFFLDGRLHKLEDVRFEYDPARWREPWRFRASDGRLDLVLDATLYQMEKRLDALVIASRLHEITGTFRGSVVTDAGERLAVAGAIGWAEEHVARW